MKTTTVLLAVGCLLAAASGQWLEATIDLGDSLGGLIHPHCLAYNSTENTIYVGGESGRCGHHAGHPCGGRFEAQIGPFQGCLPAEPGGRLCLRQGIIRLPG